MKHLLLWAFAVPTLTLLLSSKLGEDVNTLEIGQEVPLKTVPMKNTDGSKVTLENLKDENGLIVVFSCNTCPFVVGNESFKGWQTQYNELYLKAKAQNIGFVLVNSNEAKRDKDDSYKAMVSHAKKNGYNMPYLMDERSALANACGAKTTPHVFLFNAELKLAYKGSIDNSWDNKRKVDEAYLEKALKAISAKTTIETAETAPRGCSIKRK
jgi:cytochrome oxidase Cu insertion factor (SCO1/SenC/PrrC family)